MDFQELTALYEREQNHLEILIKKFPWSDKNAYIEWLANSYEYALNSTRILALAGGMMPLHLTRFSSRFITHAAEEKGHEKLLEKDVEALGSTIKMIPITDEMRLFHHSLYYWLSPMGSPIGIFGFVLALEGIAVKNGEWIYRQTKETYGDQGTKFIKVHSSEDPDHLEKAFASVKALSPEEITLVANSTTQYCRQYGRFLETVGRKYLLQKAS